MNKKIFVTKSSLPDINEYIAEIKDIWDNHWLTNMGEKHNLLATALKDYLEVDNISLMSNGHLALELCLQAFNLSGEVITTPFTFASTTHAIVRNSLEPIFCDIEPLSYTIDTDKLENLITDRTSAIVPVHVYGNVCNIEEIDRIAKKYDLKVIYDAAHAFGVKYKGKGIGTYGDATMLSFHATKVFNTIEGGAVCFSGSELELDLYRLKNFGIRGTEKVDFVGSNAKMNEFQAAMGLCNLRHIDEEINKRKIVYDLYHQCLADIPGILTMPKQKDVQTNYAYFPIIIDEKIFGFSRNNVFDELARNDINARKYFYPLTNTFDCFHGKYNVDDTPVALYIAKRVITLPFYPDLDLGEVDRICEIIKGMRK